jgi:hypothetical protein
MPCEEQPMPHHPSTLRPQSRARTSQRDRSPACWQVPMTMTMTMTTSLQTLPNTSRGRPTSTSEDRTVSSSKHIYLTHFGPFNDRPLDWNYLDRDVVGTSPRSTIPAPPSG